MTELTDGESALAGVASLEDRVAALETAMAAPLMKAYIPKWAPLSGEEEAGLRESLAEAVKQLPRVIWQPPPLSPDEIRQLLRECVTVVKPGETLILRVPWTTTPTQVRDLQDAITDMARYRDLTFKVLVVPGDELTVAEPGGIPGAA